MVNVLRIFNDETGVVSLACKQFPPDCTHPKPFSVAAAQELTQRTGKNPNYQYLQIGCSHKAIAAMLGFARQQVGKPFSSYGMMRSMIYPRTSDGSSWYCAIYCSQYTAHSKHDALGDLDRACSATPMSTGTAPSWWPPRCSAVVSWPVTATQERRRRGRSSNCTSDKAR